MAIFDKQSWEKVSHENKMYWIRKTLELVTHNGYTRDDLLLLLDYAVRYADGLEKALERACQTAARQQCNIDWITESCDLVDIHGDLACLDCTIEYYKQSETSTCRICGNELKPGAVFQSKNLFTPVCHPVYFCSQACLEKYEVFIMDVIKTKKESV